MIYGFYNSAAGMMVNEYRQDVIANNLANADTVGFKPDVAVFAERLQESQRFGRLGPSARDLENLSGYVWQGQTHTAFDPGPMVNTGNPLDVALDGPGFFLVQSDGQTFATRDGRMLVDPQGRLLSVSDGAPVLGQGDNPIVVNPFGGQPAVDQDGRIQQDGITVGRLAVVDFDDYDALRKVGVQRFAIPDEVEPVPAHARVLGGVTESSGVVPVKEMVSMIEAARAYQINARMVSLQDDSVGRLISIVNS